MKNNVIVNIYNFIRMSHVEPSIFIEDDFETVKKQIILIRQYGFPATYALKYDALMNPRYQELLKSFTGEEDEISAWWEITEELCQKAGVIFRGAWTEEYDDRVNSAYSIGYTPEERRKLVDAYMEDFYSVFGFYPKTIGSWVLDTVTVSYGAEKYGILGSAICRDQMGTDGFTLWGGYPNGIYYPSCRNENIPANTAEGQLPVPMFRLLGPDPIYNFEQDVREGLQGVYTLEPSWLIGRNPEWISWFFRCLTEEDSLGTGYAHVGQENNFLWENIRPGLEPQLKKLQELEGTLRIETMADSAAWFRRSHLLTPPVTFQASKDWDKSRNLSAQWYACSNYRLSFLGEEGHLRIRDFFLYRQDYPSRYLEAPMTNAKSTFDALPLLFPQSWTDRGGQRPFIRLFDREGHEPSGSIRYLTLDRITCRAELVRSEDGVLLAAFTLSPDRLVLEGDYGLHFDVLPVLRAIDNGRILLEHEGFAYNFETLEGKAALTEKGGLEITPEYRTAGDPGQSRILLRLGRSLRPEDIFTDPEKEAKPKSEPASEAAQKRNAPFFRSGSQKGSRSVSVPPMAPVMEPASCIFPAGSTGTVTMTFQKGILSDAASDAPEGIIRYTLDGTEPGQDSLLYTRPVTLGKNTVISARLFLPDGRCSETVSSRYCFGIPGIRLTSSTKFDPRPVFSGNGIQDLLDPRRGSLDYLDGRWRGTLEDLDLWGELPEPAFAEEILIGFLSHHRCGIIFPRDLILYTGPDREHLSLTARLSLPCEPCAKEIAGQDFSLPVRRTLKSFRLTAHRYPKMPQWCCYRGSESVFTMVDNLIVVPPLPPAL